MISVQMIEDWKTTFYQWSVGLSWNYLTQLKSWDWKILWMSSSLGKKGRSFIASLWSLRIQRNAGSYFANSLIHSIEILTKTIQLLCLLFLQWPWNEPNWQRKRRSYITMARLWQKQDVFHVFIRPSWPCWATSGIQTRSLPTTEK